jgi:hypothetical protein
MALACLGLMFLVIPSSLSAQNGPVPSLTNSTRSPATRLFPSLYFKDFINTVKKQENTRPYWVPIKEEAAVGTNNTQSILLNEDILAFYGQPTSRIMGILGRYPIGELDARLTKLAAEYRSVSGGRGVRKAFYIIYGTAWPRGEIGILNETRLMRYIEYAQKHNILVFLDHQIGRYTPAEAIRRMLPYLRFPNVHLALDPEWRTTRPMQVIGSVSGEEINQVQKIMEDYIIANNIPGERMLVIHQFKYTMITNREKVRANFSRVRLVHCADGFGPPAIKRSSYAFNARATNIPIKGFKLFYNFNIPGAGYDSPLLTPKQVYELKPRPYIIMYQ